MSDETTLNLLANQLDQIINLVENLTDKHAETDARVERLERVLEERLYDTRPIWEAVQAQVQELAGRVETIESEMTEMRAEMAGIRAQNTETLKQITEMRVENGNAFRAVDRKIGVLGKTLIDMTADIRELQDKVEKIESQPL
jgi:chromosome segregation ATPase